MLRRLWANADADAAVVFAAEVFREAFYAVMASTTASHAGADLPKVNVEFVVYHNYLFEAEFIEVENGLHGFAAEVHESLRLAEYNARVAYRFHRGETFHICFIHPGWKIVLFCKLVETVKTDVVPCAVIVFPGIAKADEQQ